jgi:HPt (histidine-containing phosphotransfer) domain-containing protein
MSVWGARTVTVDGSGDEPVGTTASSLPDDLAAWLHEAYEDEARERLVVLEAALAGDADLTEARRAAHALGSSAWVAGERAVSALARDVESRLDTRREWTEQAAALVELLRAGSGQ